MSNVLWAGIKEPWVGLGMRMKFWKGRRARPNLEEYVFCLWYDVFGVTSDP